MESFSERAIRPWLYFEPIFKLTNYYKRAMIAREKSSEKITRMILEEFRSKDFSEFAEDENEIKNPMKLLMNPKHELTEEELRDEIETILVAVSNTNHLFAIIPQSRA
jgi:hypothetical protein